MIITNESGISLPLAVWLLHDEYDYDGRENYISATSLMKPIRQLVLTQRLLPEQRKEDVGSFIPRALGHSMHDSIEKAWTKGYKRSLTLLGYPKDVIDLVRINPTDAEIKAKPDIIAIYLEQRGHREVNGYIIGGKFDMVTEGILNDTKSTSAYTWVYGAKVEDYKIQMSIYRWIDAGRPMPWVTEDFGQVNFIFTDWQKSAARSNPNYPQKRVETIKIPLMSLDETQQWIEGKLRTLLSNLGVPENRLPECTPEELWMSDPSYKYYSDPNKTSGRSTKNFDSLADANAFMSTKGGKGVVITKPGEPKRCGYCAAFDSCTQKDRYFPT